MHHTELVSRRRRLQLSQAELGKRLGVTENTIARWEKGTLAIGRSLMVKTMLQLIEAEQEQETDQQRHARSVRWHRYHGRKAKAGT